MSERGRVLRIGTRASRLARWQTDWVRSSLAARFPDLRFETVLITSAGDADGATPLPAMGGAGVFTGALETALRARTIDLAVHSLKDLPAEEPGDLVLAAIGAREDPRDVLVGPDGARKGAFVLDTLPAGSRVGTCSTRRTAQVLARRPDLEILPLRGNVDTRVAKVQRGDYEAIVLAAAGLNRLGLARVITEHLSLDWFLPAPGQAALAVQCRAADRAVREAAAALDEPLVHAATDAERTFLAELGGGCSAPVAAIALPVSAELLEMRGFVGSLDGHTNVRVHAVGAPLHAAELGRQLAGEALAQGAGALL